MAASGSGSRKTSAVTSDEKSITDQKFFDSFFLKLEYLLHIFDRQVNLAKPSSRVDVAAYKLANEDFEIFLPGEHGVSLCRINANPMLTLFGDVKTARAAHNILQRMSRDLVDSVRQQYGFTLASLCSSLSSYAVGKLFCSFKKGCF